MRHKYPDVFQKEVMDQALMMPPVIRPIITFCEYKGKIISSIEITENRYSGIPTIYKEIEKAGLMSPKFENIRRTFKVTLYNTKRTDVVNDELISKIKIYCKTSRTKESISKYFGYDEKHPAYFINSYIIPLIA